MNDVAAQLISSPTVLNRYSLAAYKPFIFPIETALVKKGASSESFSLLWTGEFAAQNGSPARLQASTTYLSVWSSLFNSMVSVGYPTSLTYTGAGGDIISFGSLARLSYETTVGCHAPSPPPPTPQYYSATPTYTADSWTWPSGVQVNFTYEDKDYWNSFGPIISDCSASKAKVLKTVSNNLGRSLTFNSTAYAPITAGLSNGSTTILYNPPLGYLINSIQDETGRAVNFTRTTCSLGMLCDTMTEQDPTGAITTYNYAATTASPNPTIIHRPSYQMHSWFAPTAPTVAAETIVYDELSRVKQVINANNISTYYFGGGLLGSELYRPGRERDSYGETLQLHDDAGNAVRSVNALGLFSRVVYDSANRPIRTISPELNEQRKAYDIRSNVLEERTIAKPGTGLADLVTTTTYTGGPTQMPYQCASAMLCNKAVATIDPRGFQTDFNWSATFGEMLTMTSPADSGGTRPLVTLGYSPFTGTTGSSFYLLTSKTEKINGSQNATTTYGYATGNKFALKEVVVDSGGLNLRTCLQSDARGNLIGKTDPKGTSGSCP
jgi:YD repeat-containing protein